MLNRPCPAEISEASVAGTLECEWAAPLSIYQLRTTVNMLVSNGAGSGSALMVRVTIQ